MEILDFMNFKTIYTSIVLALLSCGLDERYPPKGSFCDIMENPAPCLDIAFKEKIITINKETLPLSLLTRVHYEFVYKERKFELGVLGEHRIYIKELGVENAKEKVFHRRKK
jgi:hypothetical protein